MTVGIRARPSLVTEEAARVAALVHNHVMTDEGVVLSETDHTRPPVKLGRSLRAVNDILGWLSVSLNDHANRRMSSSALSSFMGLLKRFDTFADLSTLKFIPFAVRVIYTWGGPQKDLGTKDIDAYLTDSGVFG